MRTIQDFANKPRVDSTSPRVPWLKKVIVVALLMLLVVALAILLREKSTVEVEGSFIDQTDTPVIEAVAQVAKPEPKLKPKVLEQASASDFTYGVILKQTEVKPAHVKVYESTAKDPTKKTNHVLQVASFKSERDAKELQSKLIKKKLANVQVTQSTTDSGSIWFRVMVGPFQNRSMLNKAQDVLVQMNFSPLERKR
jgi:cell division septation protein DedD